MRSFAESPLLYDAGEINDQNWGDLTLTFDRGRVTFTQRNDLDGYSTSGTYTLDGKAITLTFTEGATPARPSPAVGVSIGTCSPSSAARRAPDALCPQAVASG